MTLHAVHLRSTIALGLACACFSSTAQTVMQPGGWEMKMQISALDPATRELKRMGESSSKVCLTEAFLVKDPYLSPHADVSNPAHKNARCATSNYQRAGNSASWDMVCTLGDGSEMKAKITNTVSSRSVTLGMQQEIRKPAGTGYALMDGRLSFIGACTAEMPVL